MQPTPYAPEAALPADLPTVVYAVKRPPDPAQLWTLHYEGGLLREELLLNLAPSILTGEIGSSHRYFGYRWVRSLIFSPDGQYVAIGMEAYEGVGATLITHIDSGKVYLPPGPVEGDVRGLLKAWIPGSERFVWAGSDGANWGTLAIDGSNYVHFPIHDVLDAVVTPDGKRVIFSKVPSDGIWLGAIDVDGRNLTPFLLPDPLPGLRVRNLKVSPDGQTCAFTWDREVTYRGAGQIWMMDVDGANQRALGFGETYDYGLAWSPDAGVVVFVRWDDPKPQAPTRDPAALVSSLWVIDVETGEERLLLSSERQYAHWSPQWLPDGSGLVFLSDRGGEANLWFVRPDGTGLQQLTRQGGLAGEIAVRPR